MPNNSRGDLGEPPPADDLLTLTAGGVVGIVSLLGIGRETCGGAPYLGDGYAVGLVEREGSASGSITRARPPGGAMPGSGPGPLSRVRGDTGTDVTLLLSCVPKALNIFIKPFMAGS